jgi:hypothetical protein
MSLFRDYFDNFLPDIIHWNLMGESVARNNVCNLLDCVCFGCHLDAMVRRDVLSKSKTFVRIFPCHVESVRNVREFRMTENWTCYFFGVRQSVQRKSRAHKIAAS